MWFVTGIITGLIVGAILGFTVTAIIMLDRKDDN